MSIKAYRVLSIELAQPESFDLLEDKKLMEFLRDNYKFLAVLDGEGTALIHVPTEAIERAVGEATMTLDTQAFLKRDIEFAKERNMEHIQYVVVGGK